MSGKVVNLNHARKARARDAKAVRAAENAVRFGRSKSEREAEAARAGKARRDLDGHERE
ncbi:DUF4169 family protein [Jannaschia marina]|uniref:DUF4169 family protein n=1 Tax=Jannaschia marina TaxID=2741674 RepID=UPI0015CE8D6A|nr:DUF4169 family protein [Jannaschia marina]